MDNFQTKYASEISLEVEELYLEIIEEYFQALENCKKNITRRRGTYLAQGTSGQPDAHYNIRASASQAAAAAIAHSHEMDSYQQSQTISSGSYESNTNAGIPSGPQWKQTRPQKATIMLPQQGISGSINENTEQDLSGSRPSDR